MTKVERKKAPSAKKTKPQEANKTKKIATQRKAPGNAPEKKSPVIKSLPKDVKRDERLYQNLLKSTRQFVSGKNYNPLTAEELLQRMHIAPQHFPLFMDILADCVKNGFLQLSHNCYSVVTAKDNIAIGTIQVHPRGFGFVTAEKGDLFPQDIFIPKHLTLNAVTGDKVEVLVNLESVSEKGPEGKVIAILERGRTHIAGIIKSVERTGDLIAYAPILGNTQKVVIYSNKEQNFRVGDRVVMKVIEWGKKETETIAEVSHWIGHISDPSCDIPAVIEEFGLRSDFAHEAIEEAESFGSRVSLKEMQEREDLRGLECFTIDPDSARDFDDALSLEKDKKGHYKLVVHIADVSHYVTPGSALDEEAKARCNSTYFPGFCIPMLPHALSSNLCSLKEGVNRLTVSVFMDFDKEGNLLKHRIARSVIRSSKRFTYKEAKAVLDGKKKSIHTPTLKLMTELCFLLKQKRHARGSVEFSLPDLILLVDEKGAPEKTEYVAYDITHQMVEEFMLKANEMIAWHLSKQGKNITYRVHDVPAEENLKDFSLLARIFGFQLSEKPTPAELQQLFNEAMDTAYGQYLATNYIRKMRLAIYSPENIGHYGLGLTHYCHFTSPIRRYIDLVIHRILFGGKDELAHLTEIAERCSEQERTSAKAENNVLLLKKLRLLDRYAKENPRKEYEAIVTRVKNFGISFEILELMLESFLHVSELDNDYFVFDEASQRLKGIRTKKGYHCGDRFTVLLKNVDLISLESSWHIVSEESTTIRSEKTTDKKQRPSRNREIKTGRKTARTEEKKLNKSKSKPKKKSG
jgi:ribonuclease R